MTVTKEGRKEGNIYCVMNDNCGARGFVGILGHIHIEKKNKCEKSNVIRPKMKES